ncbi:hypothetical protein JM18_003930 [Phytophthora kernoviae]|uniref:Uncharacterized protein n=1 Tax=Phytophthora kernoviae TaxID=325452 RepID=A0A921VA98_9STRA|nr:hypothetical protein JM18_003930 [Phytophthora kernoviae]
MQRTQQEGILQSTEIVQRAQTYASSAVDGVLANRSKEGAVHTSRETQTTVFQTKIERILEHLDVQKLARLAAVYILSELLNLRRVSFGITLFFLGILAQAVLHRQKIMVISMLVICLYRSQLKERVFRYTQEWVRTSTDKLVISLPLLPFVASEASDARKLYDHYHGGKLQEMDGLELLLLDSPLFRVWKNAKGCIYCLEGSVTFSKAVATGTHIVSAAARISRLAVFASQVKKEGVFANAHDIPDHIANAFLVTKDSSLIIDGVRYIRESSQFQDLQASITKWWHGGHTSEASPLKEASTS